MNLIFKFSNLCPLVLTNDMSIPSALVPVIIPTMFKYLFCIIKKILYHLYEKYHPTNRTFKKTYKTIDNLNTFDGIKLLLEDQKDSIVAINKVMKNLSFVVDEIFFKLTQSKSSRLIYAGAGTSGRIAVQDGVELLPTFGWPKKD